MTFSLFSLQNFLDPRGEIRRETSSVNNFSLPRGPHFDVTLHPQGPTPRSPPHTDVFSLFLLFTF